MGSGTNTTNYSLYKPAVDETGWGDDVNASTDIVDTQLKANADAAALNTTHSTGDGSDHADVATNTSHSTGDGSDHSAVATNTSHSTGDGSDHADVATNTSHSTGDGSDHSAVATNTSHSTGDGSDHGDVASNTSARHTRSHAITGTSDHTASNWKVVYTNGSGEVVELALGSASQVLTSSGASSAPTFEDAGASGTRGTFDDGDLSSGILTITHTLGLTTPFTLNLTIADNSQKVIIPDEVTFLTNTITVDLTSYGTLTGTWGYYYI